MLKWAPGYKLPPRWPLALRAKIVTDIQQLNESSQLQALTPL